MVTTSTIPATYQLKVLAQGGKKAELDAPASTTVGTLRETVLKAMDIQPEPNVQWFLHYRGEQLNDDSETLASVIGPINPNEQVVMHLKKQPFAGAQAPATVGEPTRTYIELHVAELRQRAEEFAIQGIEVDGVDIFVTMLARSSDGCRERYAVWLRCDGYNVEPPSAKMVDPDTHAETLSAWPNVSGGPGAIFRPNPNNPNESFVCTPGTREWYSHGHGEFRGPEHWALANIIDSIHFGLNSSGYQGRCR